jgi:NAD(P)-dependent dehydrogenase (short-subunit alcohol dehydrogenase family)
MAAPHVAGAAALLLQQHPAWTPQQVKSALMTSAQPAWGDTSRTHEASVLLEGGGLIDVAAANTPKLFSEPSSLSFGFLDTTTGATRKALLLSLSDAGTGGGAWSVAVQPQSATAGASIQPATSSVTLAPGGTVDLPIAASATHGAPTATTTASSCLTRGADRVRIPYYFSVEYPQISRAPRATLRVNQLGDTSNGTSYVNQYRFPTEPFGPPPFYTGKPFNEDGAEQVYTVRVTDHVANAGVAVVAAEPNTLIEPWFLGSLNEDDVQGYQGTPVNVNGLTFEYQFDNGAAALDFPHEGRYFVAVDSRADPYTNSPLRGKYILHAWQNDVTPPRFRFLTNGRHSRPPLAGRRSRPTAARGSTRFRSWSATSRRCCWPSLYDPVSGLVVWALDGAPKIGLGRTPVLAVASDYQESKNIDQAGEPAAEQRLPRGPRACRRQADGELAPAEDPRLRRACRGPVRDRGLHPRRAQGHLLRRRTPDRDREAGRRRALQHAVAHAQGASRSPPAAGGRDRPPRPHGVGAPARPRVPVAVVTGGSSGIGAAVARALRGRGWDCVLLARGEERLRPLAEELGAEWELCDVGDREAVERVAGAVVARHERISLLVNNAGIPGRGTFLRATAEKIEEVTRTNYLGGVWCLRAFLPRWRPLRRPTWSTSSRWRAPWPRARAALHVVQARAARLLALGRAELRPRGFACTRSSPASSRPKASRSARASGAALDARRRAGAGGRAGARRRSTATAARCSSRAGTASRRSPRPRSGTRRARCLTRHSSRR